MKVFISLEDQKEKLFSKEINHIEAKLLNLNLIYCLRMFASER